MNSIVLITKSSPKRVNEWVEYHKKKGFGPFFIYSNGDSLYNIPETFEFDIRGKEAQQLLVYQDAFSKINVGDTLTVLDDDEFYTSELNIDELWRQFPIADCLRFSWQVFGDCGQIKDDGRPLYEQFDLPCEIDCVYNKDLPEGITENFHTKYSVRKSWKQTRLGIHNALIMNGICVDMLGNLVDGTIPWMKPVWKIAFVRHYLTQDVETFLKRRANVKDATGNYCADIDKLEERFFALNKRTPEKERAFAEIRGNSKSIQSVPMLGNSTGVQPMGNQPTGPETISGKSKQTNEPIHKRAGERKK